MTDITAVRTLIGDQLAASFTDAEIAEFNLLAGVDGPGSEYYLAASIALNALTAKIATNLKEVRIGNFQDSSGRNQAASLKTASDNFYQLFLNTPAWAIVETSLSDMNTLIIIRNYVLRTNP